MMPQVLVVMLASLFLLACSSQETKTEELDEKLEAGPAELLSFDEKVDIDVVSYISAFFKYQYNSRPNVKLPVGNKRRRYGFGCRTWHCYGRFGQ